MRDVITAAGMLSLLGVPAWYVGSVLLRVAALGWFVFAGVGLLLAGHGDQSPWPFAGLGVGCWAAGHVLDRAPADGWPPRSLRAFSGRRLKRWHKTGQFCPRGRAARGGKAR